MFVPIPRWQRAVIAAVLVIPLLPVVILSAPAWVAWPFLSTDRRAAVMQFLDRIIEWIKVLSHIR
jgi:hypothetical protein